MKTTDVERGAYIEVQYWPSKRGKPVATLVARLDRLEAIVYGAIPDPESANKVWAAIVAAAGGDDGEEEAG